jgi:hypothetical protein
MGDRQRHAAAADAIQQPRSTLQLRPELACQMLCQPLTCSPAHSPTHLPTHPTHPTPQRNKSALSFQTSAMSELTFGSAARSKQSVTRVRRLCASCRDLRKWQCSDTPGTPNVLFTLPICTQDRAAAAAAAAA